MKNPIGIFDSGLGGLTVFSQIASLLPHENLIYLGDTARVPYGVKSPKTVLRYCQEICDFLLRHDVKCIIVACNTASALALEQLQKWYQVPILGVLQPGVVAALQEGRAKKIGVIGTEATIRSESYPKTIKKYLPDVEVFSQSCPLFVPLVEEGWTHHDITRQVAEIYLGHWKDIQLDALILGCTHYPLLKDIIGEVLGPQVKLVDSALETAKKLKEDLEKNKTLKNSKQNRELIFFSTDAPDKMKNLAKRFIGQEISSVKIANLSS